MCAIKREREPKHIFLFLPCFAINKLIFKFEDEEEREIQAPSTTIGVDINSLLAAMMEKMQVANYKLADVQEASSAEDQMLFEASRAENQKLLADVQEASRAENQSLLAESRKDSRKNRSSKPKTCSKKWKYQTKSYFQLQSQKP